MLSKGNLFTETFLLSPMKAMFANISNLAWLLKNSNEYRDG